MIDTSIYGNIRPAQVEMPNPLDSAHKAMSLSALAMQQRQMAQTFQSQQALKTAYAKNIGPDGKINTDGVLSDLAQHPEVAMQFQEHIAKTKKADAESQTAALTAQKGLDDLMEPKLRYLATVAPDQQPMAYQNVMAELAKIPGIPMDRAPAEFKRDWLDRTLGALDQRKEHYDILNTRAQTANTQANTAFKKEEARKVPYEIAKLQAETDKAGLEKEPKQNQYAAALYGQRATQAENVFGELAGKGYDPTANLNALQKSLPGALEGLKSEDTKRQDQAERNFVNAILRRESGAAISKDEFANAGKQYFPRIGDSAEVLRQKEENRKTATAALLAEGGPAMSRIQDQMKGMTLGSSVPASKGGSGIISEAQADGKGPAKPAMSSQDQEAVSWAKNNFKDPRAKRILRMHGMY